MGNSHRSHKVADRIKVVVAQLLETKIKDPRLGFVTVTVRVLLEISRTLPSSTPFLVEKMNALQLLRLSNQLKVLSVAL